METNDFCEALKQQGFDFYTGVPCSFLKDIIRFLQVDSDILYVAATREDEAIGIAVGACLAGHRPVVLMQNSGLGNSMGTLATLPLLYGFPILLLISWRGYNGKDAPEHAIIGKRTVDLLRGLRIKAATLTKKDADVQIRDIAEVMKRLKAPVALLLRGGIIS